MSQENDLSHVSVYQPLTIQSDFFPELFESILNQMYSGLSYSEEFQSQEVHNIILPTFNSSKPDERKYIWIDDDSSIPPSNSSKSEIKRKYIWIDDDDEMKKKGKDLNDDKTSSEGAESDEKTSESEEFLDKYDREGICTTETRIKKRRIDQLQTNEIFSKKIHYQESIPQQQKSIPQEKGARGIKRFSSGSFAHKFLPLEPHAQKRKKRKVDFESPIRVIILADSVFKLHYTGKDHPESPARFDAIKKALKQAGLKNKKNSLIPRIATKEEILLCHTERYYKEVKKQVKELDAGTQQFSSDICHAPHVEGDFQISPMTFISSLFAAGTPLTAIDYILNPDNHTKRAFCIVRPPGHHAHANTGSGFCVFNNVAIAARYAIQKGIERVLVVDWDVHHGDGIQELTKGDRDIFYFSTHKDTKIDNFYPGSHWGHRDQIGENKGIGTVLNCPIDPSKENPRTAIRKAFAEDLSKAMDVFKPKLILISCGFDAHKNDTLVGLGLEDEDYVFLTEICVQIANKYADGRIISVLEGGYSLEAIAGAAKVHVEALGSVQ